MKSLTLYFKRNLYFILSMLTVFLTVIFAIILLFVFDLGKGVAQTSVGFVYLGSVEKSEYDDVLTPRVLQWQNTADYAVSYQEYEWIIDLKHFEFDVLTTVNSIRQDRNNPAYFTLSDAAEDALFDDITAGFNPLMMTTFDFDKFLSDLNQDMQLLKNRKTYEIKGYLTDEVASTLIHELSIDNISLDLMNELLTETPETIIIPANRRFYLIDALKDSEISNEALSIIASALKYLLVFSPAEGFIFEPYDTLPIWAEPGMNVRILRLNQYDFSFFNPLKEDLILTLTESAPNKVLFTLKGYPLLTSYEREVVLGPTIYYQTTYIDNPALNELTPGVTSTDTDTETIYELLITPGADGYITYYNRKITKLDGTISSLLLYYEEVLPVQEVIEQNRVVKG